MQLKPLYLRALSASAALALFGFAGAALADHPDREDRYPADREDRYSGDREDRYRDDRADPPSRVARLGYTTGDVSFSPGGEDEWEDARINRPLGTGDRLWADEGGRAEVQVGGAMIRMSDDTGISFLNLDDEIAQLQLTQGRLNIRVQHLERGQVFEIATPNLAFAIREPSELRIEVDPDGSATTIVVRHGSGEAYGDGESYVIDSEEAYQFYGNELSDYELVDEPRFDSFDRWSRDRDRRYDRSPSARYVSRDVLGYQDLDDYGSWRNDSVYGHVWFPRRVSVGWAPYRDGHWAWIDPWGWTWVDDAPWGFAVSHYGRWAHRGGNWCWVPGPVRNRAYYAPALVAFVGGSNFQLSISSRNVYGVAWFPLGPREVYRPSYRVSRRYFENLNRSNTVINNTTIINNNYYNRSDVTNVTYVNRRVPGGVVAMPRSAFVERQRVSASAVAQAPREVLANAPVILAPFATPTEKSVRGGATRRERPPARVFDRPVVARSAPPPPRVGFESQRQRLRAHPGRPLDNVARRDLDRSEASPAPVVKVVAPTRIAKPTRRPPQRERGARSRGEASRKNERELLRENPPVSTAPQARAQEEARAEQRVRPNSPQAVEQAAPTNEEARREPSSPAVPSETRPVPVAARSEAERAADQAERASDQAERAAERAERAAKRDAERRAVERRAARANEEAQLAPGAGRSQAERAANARKREIEKAKRAKRGDPSIEDEDEVDEEANPEAEAVDLR